MLTYRIYLSTGEYVRVDQVSAIMVDGAGALHLGRKLWIGNASMGKERDVAGQIFAPGFWIYTLLETDEMLEEEAKQLAEAQKEALTAGEMKNAQSA